MHTIIEITYEPWLGFAIKVKILTSAKFLGKWLKVSKVNFMRTLPFHWLLAIWFSRYAVTWLIAVSFNQQLTCWGKWKFQMHFLEWKFLYDDLNFTEVCSLRSNWQYIIIGSGNGLVPHGHYMIIYINPVSWEYRAVNVLKRGDRSVSE